MQVGNELWYTAAHKNTNGKTYRWNNENYLDIYAHPLDSLMVTDSNSRELSPIINTKMHEGAFTITADQNTIYFTRNNYLKGKRKTDENKVSHLKIYKAERLDGEWKNITAVSYTHLTLPTILLV